MKIKIETDEGEPILNIDLPLDQRGNAEFTYNPTFYRARGRRVELREGDFYISVDALAHHIKAIAGLVPRRTL